MNLELTDLLDPELRGPICAMFEQMPPTDFTDLPAARANSRKQTEEMMKRLPPFKGVITEDRLIPGPPDSPDVPVRIYRPENRSGLLPAFLWIHGGGYIMGDLDSMDYPTRQLCLDGDCVIVSVDYRLAPEHPYPAPLEDCYAALKWLKNSADELNIDTGRISVGGGSAGGGLAAGLALLARDRAEVEVMFQLLIYPMIDDRNTIPAGNGVRDALLWTRALNLLGWRSYLGREPGSPGVPGYASPSRAENLKGLPKTYICVGDLDLFAIENIDYAGRLVAAGVSTELHVYPGGCHAFDGLVPKADVSCRFTADISRALRRALHP